MTYMVRGRSEVGVAARTRSAFGELSIERAPFRPDIQGLRAVAVLLVVLFHAGWSVTSGGYVGVDAFFVISGFLITNHLLAQASERGFVDVRSFYARRILRILPASFVVVALTAVAAVLMMPGVRLGDVMRDAAWTALYVPNVALAVAGTDYLAETEPSPFQHFWSLGVEEQFYVFWPAVLMLIAAFAGLRRRITLRAVAVLAMASFGLGWWLTYVSQPWAYFSLPTRAWQLGAGALIALSGTRWVSHIPRRVRAALAWVGLGLMALAAVFFDEYTAYPGTAALVPVLGAALVIAMGQEHVAGGASLVLNRAPMQFLGRISYSLYLVHWPLIVIPQSANNWDLDPIWLVVLVMLMVPAAWLLHVGVEEPMRKLSVDQGRVKTVVTSALGVSALIAVIAFGASWWLGGRTLDSGRESDSVLPRTAGAGNEAMPVFTDFVPTDLTPSLQEAELSVPAIYTDGCHADINQTVVQDCAYGDAGSDVRVALFGDSHAAQWFPAVEAWASANGVRLEVYTKSACPAAQVPTAINGGVPYTSCDTWREAVIARLNDNPPNLVIASNLVNGPDVLNGPASASEWATGMTRTVERLVSDVVVLADTPYVGFTPANCLSLHLTSASQCAVPRSEALDAGWSSAVNSAAEAAGAAVIDLNDRICDGTTCGPIIGNTLVYRDSHHLTVEFTLYLEKVLAEALDDAMTAAAHP